MDVYELLAQEDNASVTDENSVFGRIKALVTEEFASVRFNSDQVRRAFEDRYDRAIELAEISTYLSRMNEQGKVDRVKRGRGWLYTVPGPVQTPTSHFMTDQKARFKEIIER
jgi:hypothetical protein